MQRQKERHDKAVEQLEAAQTELNKKRTASLDFINEEM